MGSPSPARPPDPRAEGGRPGARPAGLLAPLAGRQFRLLWTGLAVSLVGDGVLLVALAWQAYALSGGPGALALVGLAMSAPQVVLLLAGGVISDRCDRRRVMLVCDLARGGVLGAMGALALGGGLTPGRLVALAALYGCAGAFSGPAFDAMVPDLVPGPLLAQANALDQLVRPLAQRLAGPAAGGVVVSALGPGAGFLLDAATFAASAAALALMSRGAPPARRPRGAEPPRRAVAGAAREAREGLRFVRAHVWLWGTFLAATVGYLLFLGPTEVLLPFMARTELHGGPALLGAVLALGGLGAVGAAAAVGRRGVPPGEMTFIYGCWALATLAVAGYGLAAFPWQLMAACLAFNALEAAGTVAWATTKHRRVPRELLGRVSSLDWLVSTALVPVSFALTGPAAAALGARATLVAAGAAGAAATIGFLFLPGMRRPAGAAAGPPRLTAPAGSAAAPRA